MGLCLTRRLYQKINLHLTTGELIEVEIVGISNQLGDNPQIRVKLKAPKDVLIMRSEIDTGDIS